MAELDKEEIIKLKTLCEFLFSNRYQCWATYERFEKCFQPLFNTNININLYNAFISIVGENKKYIIYPRLVKAYMRYKNGEFPHNTDIFIFFEEIKKILINIEKPVGKHEDYSKESNIISLSTKRARIFKTTGLKETFLSKIQVLNDKEERIRGIILEFDDSNKYELYPVENKDELLLGLEINLGLINRKNLIINKKSKKNDVNMSLYRNSITHIFGTFNKDSHTINFLGFKRVSGKMRFIGIPEGEAFLFGEFGKKFDNLRLEINKEKGITLFEPGFIENKNVNYLLKNYGNNLGLDEVDKNLFEENILINCDQNKLNQIITTNIIEEEEDYEEESGDNNPGYDYKEIINLSNRNWIKNKENEKSNSENSEPKNIFSNENSFFNSASMNQDQDINEIYSYNPNPFYQGETHHIKIQVDNPFFPKIKDQSKSNDIKLCLHKSVILFPKKEKIFKISDNKLLKVIKNQKLKDIFKKSDFNSIIEKLGKSIFEEFYKKYERNNNLIPFSIINQVFPFELDERGKNTNKKINIKKSEFKINGDNIKLNGVNENEIELVKEEKDIKKDIITSDAGSLQDEIKQEIEYMRKVNDKSCGEYWLKKWQSFQIRKKRQLFSSRILLPTIWQIKLMLNRVFKLSERNISLKEKIEYYKVLSDKDNEKIINFLTQKSNYDNYDKNENKNEIILELNNENSSDKDNEINMSLNDYDNKIKDLEEKILNNKDKKIKLEKLHCFIKRNIYIENFTNSKKEELMDDGNLINEIKGPMKKILGFDMNKEQENENLKGNLFGELRKRISWEMKKENKKSQLFKSSFYFENNSIIDVEKNEHFHGQNTIDEDDDNNFRHDKNSLCPNLEGNLELPERVLRSDVEGWELIKWKKYQGIEIFRKNSKPELDNIRQGEYIGDCYFLSALGSLCEKGEYLKKLISKVKNDDVTIGYKVKLNINGKWKNVLVDKFLPVIEENGSNKLCFGSSFKKELWVSLFEKAFAKINGCYARIGCGGQCGEAFDILTDAYSEFHQIIGINVERKEMLWKKLKESKGKENKENSYVICAGTRRFGFWDGFGINIGLISCHAYTIINIYDEIIGKEHYKLVKLRNPWGEKEFNGDWSDKSSKWNNILKKIFEFEEVKDDGIFYMSFDDFTKYFKSLEILKIKENYEIMASCKISKAEAYRCQIIKFSIEKQEKGYLENPNKIVFINLYQKNPRIIRKNGSYYPQPVKSFIILAKKDSKDNYIYIKSITETRVHLALEAELRICEKGEEYYIFCDVNYRFVYDEIYGYNITFYSLNKNKIICENITNNKSAKERSELLNKVLYNFCEKNKNNEDIFEKAKENRNVEIRCLKSYNEEFPFKILLLKNKSKNEKYFTLELNYKSKTKNVCIYNDSDANEFDSCVIKQINNDYSIVLIMGYNLTDVFTFTNYVTDKKPIIKHSIFKKKYKRKGIFNHYLDSAENGKGFILGLENAGKKNIKMNIEFKGLNVIDPEYDCFSKEDIVEIKNIKFEKDEKKLFNLRFKPGYNEFNYDLFY